MKKIILLVALAIFAISCAEKIDSSSDEKLESSIGSIRKSLDLFERKQFDDALYFLEYTAVDFAKKHNIGFNYKAIINSKTAKEIIAECEVIKKKQAEIQELYDKKATIEKNKQELKKIKIIKSNFSTTKDFLGDNQSTIEITIKNEIGVSISRIYFHAKLKSPIRVAWAEDDMNFSIPGGLENNEEKTWKLSPQLNSNLSNVDVPTDAVLMLEVMGVADKDGNNLYPTSEKDIDGMRTSKNLKVVVDRNSDLYNNDILKQLSNINVQNNFTIDSPEKLGDIENARNKSLYEAIPQYDDDGTSSYANDE